MTQNVQVANSATAPIHAKRSFLSATGKFVLNSLFEEGLTWARQIVAASVFAVVVGIVVYVMGAKDLLSRFGINIDSVNIVPASQTPKIHGTSLTATGWVKQLFDGKSLRGWFPQHGSWTVSHDDEGGNTIAGTDGEILHPLLFKRADGKTAPLSNYRLLVTVRLHEATAVELHFDVNLSGQQHVLKLTPEHVALGQCAASRAPFEPLAAAQPRPIGTTELHELKLERQASEWRVFVDEALIGTIPLATERELPEFRLVAEGGPAWFADIVIEELSDSLQPNIDQRPPAAQSTIN